ncbi:MAG: hypothetical protein Q7U56_14025 [Humidesulfovibrio sp.]|nr:hypothetical protein [Humidesulfovibrio sp.]
MANETQNGMLRGHRAIREFLGVRMGVVSVLVAYDAERGGRVFTQHGQAKRKTVRADKVGVLGLYREWCAECHGAEP